MRTSELIIIGLPNFLFGSPIGLLAILNLVLVQRFIGKNNFVNAKAPKKLEAVKAK